MRSPHSLAIVVLLLLLVPGATAQEADQKKPLTLDDYAQWQTPGFALLSPDGRWFSTPINLVDGDGWTIVRRIGSDDEQKLDLATRGVFSGDSRHFAFLIQKGQDEVKKMEKAKKPVRTDLAILALDSGTIDTFATVQAYTFSEDGRWLAMRKYAAEGSKSGADIVVRDLSTGTNLAIGNVDEYAFSEEHPLLAVVIRAENDLGNGVHLYDLPSGTVRVLDSGETPYSGLDWHEDGTALAFLKEIQDHDLLDPPHVAMAFTEVHRSPVRHVYDAATDDRFPEDMRIAAEGGIDWARDAHIAFVGLKKAEREEDHDAEAADTTAAERADTTAGAPDTTAADSTAVMPDKDDDLDPPGVDVWHWKDDRIQPQQQVLAGRDRQYTYTAAWHLGSGDLVRLADDALREVNPLNDGVHAFGYDARPYEPTFREEWRDVYAVDTRTGERTLVLDRVEFVYPSPGSRYVLYFRGGDWWSIDMESLEHANLTESADARFDNFTAVFGREENRPWGMGMWVEDDMWVLLYDQYDIWRARPDGSRIERLTDGTPDRIRHRIVRLDFEQQAIERGETVYVSLYGDRTKDSGYGRLRDDEFAVLLYEPRSISRLAKADDAGRLVYLTQTADESPNYHAVDASFDNPVQLTDTNPQQADYHWAGTELVTFTNVEGDTLQGRLLYPAEYEPGRTYPMIVYIYELRSQGLHSYSTPSTRSAYNQRRFSSEGYFVFEPDITYRLRDPGLSAVEHIVPAVETVLETGMVDPARIGLTGHSWGAYQTTFVITQTDLFAAAVAGAPLTNLVSMYSSVYWNTGATDAQIFEVSQGRFPDPWWEDMESYVRNSPVHQMTNATTPLLVAFGDNDGAVEYNQGVELYTTMRRMQKPFVMLVYEGENHGLRKEENQIDYATRTHEWFAHYLKGEEPAAWITEGLPFLEKELEKKKQEEARKER